MGRKTKNQEHRDVNQILEGAAPKAAQLIRDLIIGTRKRIGEFRYKAVIFDIEQVIGKARQKIEHSGSILSYKSIADSAKELEEKAPALLIKEAEQVAQDHQDKTEQSS